MSWNVDIFHGVGGVIDFSINRVIVCAGPSRNGVVCAPVAVQTLDRVINRIQRVKPWVPQVVLCESSMYWSVSKLIKNLTLITRQPGKVYMNYRN